MTTRFGDTGDVRVTVQAACGTSVLQDSKVVRVLGEFPPSRPPEQAAQLLLFRSSGSGAGGVYATDVLVIPGRAQRGRGASKRSSDAPSLAGLHFPICKINTDNSYVHGIHRLHMAQMRTRLRDLTRSPSSNRAGVGLRLCLPTGCLSSTPVI